MYQQIEKLRLFLTHAKQGFVILETMKPSYIKNMIYDQLNLQSKAVIIDMKTFSPRLTSLTYFITQKVEAHENRSIVVINHLNHISKYYPTGDFDVAQIINFSRDLLSDFNKIFIFILPVYFVNVLIHYAKDFYDFVILKIEFQTDDFLQPDLKFLKNRLIFQKDLLANCNNPTKKAKIIDEIASIEKEYMAKTGEAFGMPENKLDLAQKTAYNLDFNQKMSDIIQE